MKIVSCMLLAWTFPPSTVNMCWSSYVLHNMLKESFVFLITCGGGLLLKILQHFCLKQYDSRPRNKGVQDRGNKSPFFYGARPKHIQHWNWGKGGATSGFCVYRVHAVTTLAKLLVYLCHCPEMKIFFSFEQWQRYTRSLANVVTAYARYTQKPNGFKAITATVLKSYRCLCIPCVCRYNARKTPCVPLSLFKNKNILFFWTMITVYKEFCERCDSIHTVYTKT